MNPTRPCRVALALLAMCTCAALSCSSSGPKPVLKKPGKNEQAPQGNLGGGNGGTPIDTGGGNGGWQSPIGPAPSPFLDGSPQGSTPPFNAPPPGMNGPIGGQPPMGNYPPPGGNYPPPGNNTPPQGNSPWQNNGPPPQNQPPPQGNNPWQNNGPPPGPPLSPTPSPLAPNFSPTPLVSPSPLSPPPGDGDSNLSSATISISRDQSGTIQITAGASAPKDSAIGVYAHANLKMTYDPSAAVVATVPLQPVVVLDKFKSPPGQSTGPYIPLCSKPYSLPIGQVIRLSLTDFTAESCPSTVKENP